MNTRFFFRSVIPAMTFALLAACGDNIENVTQTGMDVVASSDDLPECTKNSEGDVAFVKEDGSTRVCVDGEWVVSSAGAAGFSCKAEELKDKSGLKIVCNGDSIGVVLNGEKGESGKDGSNGTDGKAGAGCAMTGKTDSTVTVVCGDSTMVIDLTAGLPADTAEADSERVAVSLDSLAGYTQKGPFLKGSTVYLYELSDGRTLKQTNGNFTSIITRDDGRYKFTARDLASQYAMIMVDGYYRNEVTGEKSDASIRLRALTDMRKNTDANINLLTHLEFDRVYYLVTQEKKTVKQAKKQAQKEIFKAFYFDTTAISGSAEDLDVFGDSDADAALLAISILLQGDGSANDLSVILTLIANDLETDGVWNDSESKAQIADWAFNADIDGRYANFRKNVRHWRLSPTVPPFEKYIRSFYEGVYNFGACDGVKNLVGTVKYVPDVYSDYRADSLFDKNHSLDRFVCRSDSRWHFAYNTEKDVYGWPDTSIGAVKRGGITRYPYIYTKDGWQGFTGNVYYALLSNLRDPSQTFGYVGDSTGFRHLIDDSAEGGASTVQLEVSDENQVIVNYTLNVGTSASAPYAGFGYLMAGVDGSGHRLSRDVSSWEGLCVEYESDIPVILELETAGSAANPSIDLSLFSNEMGYSCFGWDVFENGEQASKSLVSMNFKVVGGDGQTGSFRLKYMYKISFFRNDPIPEPVLSTDGCGDLWCGEKLDYNVNFGNGSVGHWFDINAEYSTEKSTVRYPIGRSQVRLEEAVNEVVDACYGICGSYSLTGDYTTNFVTVGFSMSEEGNVPVDISSWEGICVAYESDIEIFVQIGLTNQRELEALFDIPTTKLPKASGMQVKDLSWEDFGQNGWGGDLEISGQDAAKEAASIKFMIQSADSTAKGSFGIYGIGRKGTCGL